MKILLKKLILISSGQGLVDYALLISLMVLGVIGALTLFGENLGSLGIKNANAIINLLK